MYTCIVFVVFIYLFHIFLFKKIKYVLEKSEVKRRGIDIFGLIVAFIFSLSYSFIFYSYIKKHPSFFPFNSTLLFLVFTLSFITWNLSGIH